MRCMLMPDFENRVLNDKYYYSKMCQEIDYKKEILRHYLEKLPLNDHSKEFLKTILKKF